MNTRLRIIMADLSKTGHRNAYVSLIDAYKSGPTGDGKPLGGSAKIRLIKALRKNPLARVYFALYRESIIGCATCFSGFSTFHAKKLVNIHDLFIEKDHRGKGAARTLLAYIESKAKSEGCCKVTLEALENNKAALCLYRGLGFGEGQPTAYFLTKPIK